MKRGNNAAAVFQFHGAAAAIDHATRLDRDVPRVHDLAAADLKRAGNDKVGASRLKKGIEFLQNFYTEVAPV